MYECSMMVAMHTGLYCALTAPSMTCMTSHTSKLLVNFVTILDLAFALNGNREDDNWLIGRLMAWFGVDYIRMVRTTLAHAQMNYHVSQFGHWNQDIADMEQNMNTNCFSHLYTVKNFNFPIYSSADPGAVTISLSHSDFYMVISLGGNMQG